MMPRLRLAAPHLTAADIETLAAHSGQIITPPRLLHPSSRIREPGREWTPAEHGWHMWMYEVVLSEENL